MKRTWMGAVAAVTLLACGGYDVSGEGNAVNTGPLNDRQALSAVIDAHRQQVDILGLARGRVRHATVAYLVVANLAAEQGELARHELLLGVLPGTYETGSAYSQLHGMANDAYRALGDLHGEDFDRQFLIHERRLFSSMINFIDNRLSEDADSLAWRAELWATRDSYQKRVTDVINAQKFLGF